MNDMEDFLNGITNAIDAETLDVAEAAQRTAEYVQSRLQCDVVSFWILEGRAPSRGARRIACADVDDPSAHLKLKELEPAVCSDYLELIATSGLFVSPDALNDPLLAALREEYLVPAGIRSTLCVTVAVNGESTAVISCSQRHALRAWTAAEVANMQRLAAQISLRRARRRSNERAAQALADAITSPGLLTHLES